jgi:hypothetical protein
MSPVIDWTTIAQLATAGGTLVLAAATFSSVRSANRTARVAQEALLVQTRPVLGVSRPSDEMQKITWGGDTTHWTRVTGGHASVEYEDGIIYLVLSLRNIGAGIAVIQGWYPHGNWVTGAEPHPPIEEFRPQSRDLYVAAGELSFWQGAIREADDRHRQALTEVVTTRERFTIDLYYSDHNGGQRAVSRFGIWPTDHDDTQWIAAAARHWSLDRANPR